MKYFYIVLILMIFSNIIFSTEEIKLVYFNGNKSNLLLRTYIYGDFENENVNVVLYTRMQILDSKYFKIPKKKYNILGFKKKYSKKYSKMKNEYNYNYLGFGKLDGIETVNNMLNKDFSGATVGESSFLYCIQAGYPIIAVALLGHDINKYPGKAIILRKDVIINKPEDFRGKTLISRRAGPGNYVFLREFLKSIGMLNDPKINIIDDVIEEKTKELILNGKIDGGLYHYMRIKKLIKKKKVYIYQRMNWANNQHSSALLVFNKKFYNNNKETIQKIINAYVKRIHYEHFNLNYIYEKNRFKKMSIAVYDDKPIVNSKLLNEMQDLLFEYKKIDKKVDVNNYIDNSFVEKAYKKIINDNQKK